MNRKIAFHGMDHSNPIEQHANQKLDKIKELLKNAENITPFTQTLFLKANKLHPHHRAELNLKTPRFNLNSHAEGTDMYVAIDNTVDKMVKLIKKEKDKLQDKIQKTGSEKSDFIEDKYTLSDSTAEEYKPSDK